MLTENDQDIIDRMLRALGRNAANVTDPVAVAKSVHQELQGLRYEVKRLISEREHLYEMFTAYKLLGRRVHGYFERRESARCNPSPDNDPAMEIQPCRNTDSPVLEGK